MDEKIVTIAAKLYAARKAMVLLYGPEGFRERARRTHETTREVAGLLGTGELEAAQKIAEAAQRDGNPYTALLVLAAYVESVEPLPR